ncbi:MAG: acetyl-CoA carboxylase biotin carboxyl carrier protein [Lachnospiraceae bacterium]|nr:acetyl-CoA carboxylase biotin carboxyl carrier protein [Lachnospiraceae bacterium]
MDLERIKGIVELIEKTSFDEFSYSDGDESITLKRNNQTETPVVYTERKEVKKIEERTEETENDEYQYILSPMVGTFYNSPSPESPTFVKVGDQVKSGETVCIIEAMKLMNEIDCPFEAEIVSVIVSNEQKVEYGQPLFKIKKL